MWGGPLLILLLGIHIYFTIRTGFVQRKIKKAVKYSVRGDASEGMSAFGTLTTTLAATLGTGNIIGVSTAVYLGGPGGVFWCWDGTSWHGDDLCRDKALLPVPQQTRRA